MLLPIASFAQEEIKVSGTVKSSIDNSPLNGVDIYDRIRKIIKGLAPFCTFWSDTLSGGICYVNQYFSG